MTKPPDDRDRVVQFRKRDEDDREHETDQRQRWRKQAERPIVDCERESFELSTTVEDGISTEPFRRWVEANAPPRDSLVETPEKLMTCLQAVAWGAFSSPRPFPFSSIGTASSFKSVRTNRPLGLLADFGAVTDRYKQKKHPTWFSYRTRKTDRDQPLHTEIQRRRGFPLRCHNCRVSL